MSTQTITRSGSLPLSAAPPIRPTVPGLAPSAHKLALVIPTLRERGNIVAVLDEVRAALAPLSLAWEVLVVDDDSRDGTAEAVLSVCRADPRVRLLVRRGQRGLSGAILHGWQHTDATLLAAMDADLQHPPRLLPQLLQAIHDGHDLAIASRYARGGELGPWNPLRRLSSAAAVWATRPLQRQWLRICDPMSGYFVVRRSCVQHISFQPSGFKLLLEILVRGRLQSVREIPFVFGQRRAGSSKAGLRVALEYLRLLARLYRLRWSWQRDLRSAAAD